MANSITAKIGADVAPLKKDLGDAAQIAKATSRKIADDQRALAKKADADFKASVKARADAEKSAAQARLDAEKSAAAKAHAIHEKFTATTKARQAEISSKVNTVASALPGGGGPLGVVGDLIGKAGPAGAAIGAVVAVVGTIAKGMSDARDASIQMKREMGEMARESYTALGPEALGQVEKIGEKMRDIRKDKIAAQQDMLFGAGMIEGTVSNTRLGAVGEGANNALGRMVGHKSAADQQSDREVALLKQRDALLQSSADSAREENNIAEIRVKVGEREAALAESELRSRREIALIERNLSKYNIPQAKQDIATAPIRERQKVEAAEIERQRAEEARDRADEKGRAQAGAQANVAGMISPRAGAEMAIKQTRAEAAKKRKYANASGVPEERRNELLHQADLLDVQGDQAEAQLRVQTGMMTPAEKRQERESVRVNTRKAHAADARERDRAGREARKAGGAGGLTSGGLSTGVLSSHNLNPTVRGAGKTAGAGELAAAIITAIQGATLVIKNTP